MAVYSKRVRHEGKEDPNLISLTTTSVPMKYDYTVDNHGGLDVTDALVLTFSILLGLLFYIIIIVVIYLYLRDRNRQRDCKENFISLGVQTDPLTPRRVSSNSQSSFRSVVQSSTSSHTRRSSTQTKRHMSIQVTPQTLTITLMPHEIQDLVEKVTEITKPNASQKSRRIFPQPATVIPPQKPYPINPPPKCPTALPQECPIIIISPPQKSLSLATEQLTDQFIADRMTLLMNELTGEQENLD
ncbi:10410_t:CDS:1, partial [Acaulospora morrowiae]